ncbi:hypothetical protein [Burkholderia pseudomallei]|uniref:hypothetical protein n=1 Tax=Burkholderia pseudomallei TaxID=28450 RepID=UPI000A1A1448|nr:hypothetical protein [Burkholderia pseudomallei]ARL90986.1 hypothetical protein BOC57_34965 [Burkholderia pseudomallei]
MKQLMELDPNIVIDRLGGTGAVAEICDIRDPSVSGWRKNGIPKPWLRFLKVAFPEAFRPVEASINEISETAGK